MTQPLPWNSDDLGRVGGPSVSLRPLLDLLPVGVAVLDAEGRVLFSNAVAETLASGGGEFQDRDFFSTVGPAFEQIVPAERFRSLVLGEGQVVRAVGAIPAREGDRDLSVAITPFTGMEGARALV